MARHLSHIQQRFANRLNLVLLGAPFAFKGTLGKFLAEVYGRHDHDIGPKKGFHRVVVGDLINDKIETDAEFARYNAKIVTDGNLLPDIDAHNIAMVEYNRGLALGYSRFCIDGHGRTANQIKIMIDACLLGDNSICLILDVDEENLAARIAYSETTGDRKKRLDNAKALDRIKKFRDNINEVKAVLLANRIDHEHFDANGAPDEFNERALDRIARLCPLPTPPIIAIPRAAAEASPIPRQETESSAFASQGLAFA